ncbi:nuclease-related domain-containing protein [Thermoflexus sp.]|uniref:nuclease-related domain-containing protein n=1 Tax=Thermoflexus sp. TaxID=1969742 RepID=UPI002ADE1DB6|nr:nuclease-related domain-containing protein [Thermoflexus sp.]
MRRKRTLMAVTLGGSLLLIAAALLLGEGRAPGIGRAGWLALALMIRLGSDLLDRIARRGERAVRRAERGAYAEEQVGRILEERGDGFLVIHDLESPYGNIDHLVITREGRIFLLETKSHPGRITADGERLLRNGRPIEKDPIQQVLRNIRWLKGQLRERIGREPWIEGVVVFSRAFVPADLVVRGVRVQNIRYLRQTLQMAGRGDPALWEARERIRQVWKGKSEG